MGAVAPVGFALGQLFSGLCPTTAASYVGSECSPRNSPVTASLDPWAREEKHSQPCRSPPEPKRPYCNQHFAGAAPALEQGHRCLLQDTAQVSAPLLLFKPHC